MRNICIALGLTFSCVLLTATAAEKAENVRDGGLVVDLSGGVIQPDGMFTVLTYEAPNAVRLGDTGLMEAGLTGGSIILKSDEIRIFANKDQRNASPLARIWLNASEGNAYWFQTGGDGAAADFEIPKGAMVVVWTRASTDPVKWKNIFE